LPHPLAPDLERLAADIAATSGLLVRGLQVLTHRIPMTVLVQVQRIDGVDISLDECAAYSGRFSEALDAAECLQEAYVLEVSSPGVSEELDSDRDFRSFRGFPVEILSRHEQDGEQRRTGLLLERDDTDVLLNVRGRTLRIPRGTVISVRLISPET
jgi:ribosome maturation factor RimP